MDSVTAEIKRKNPLKTMTIGERDAAWEEIHGKKAVIQEEAFEKAKERWPSLPENYYDIPPKNNGVPTSDVVIIGERHNDPATRAAYSEILEGLQKQGFNTLCFEYPDNTKNASTLNALKRDTENPPANFQELLKESNIHPAIIHAVRLGMEILFTDSRHADDVPKQDGNAIPDLEFNPEDILSILGRDATAKYIREEKVWMEMRDRSMALRLVTEADKRNKVIHIGGMGHNPKIQDLFARMRNKRPLSILMESPEQPIDQKSGLANNTFTCASASEVISTVIEQISLTKKRDTKEGQESMPQKKKNTDPEMGVI